MSESLLLTGDDFSTQIMSKSTQHKKYNIGEPFLVYVGIISAIAQSMLYRKLPCKNNPCKKSPCLVDYRIS